jgi:tetratricopeptide (TPR) repeat protein
MDEERQLEERIVDWVEFNKNKSLFYYLKMFFFPPILLFITFLFKGDFFEFWGLRLLILILSTTTISFIYYINLLKMDIYPQINDLLIKNNEHKRLLEMFQEHTPLKENELLFSYAGYMSLIEKKHANSEKIFLDLLIINSTSKSYKIFLCLSYAEQNKKNKCIKILKEIELGKIDNLTIQELGNLGRVYFLLSKLEDSEKFFKKLIELQPKDKIAKYHLMKINEKVVKIS